MTRKWWWSLLACFAQLTAAPGCLQLPYFHKASSEDVIPQRPPLERGVLSTAQPREDEPPTKSQSKMPIRPRKDDLPILVEPKKADAGKSAVITIENREPQTEVVQIEKRREYPFVAAIQCMLEKRHDEAIQHLRAYDPETQEFFLRLVPPLVLAVQKPIRDLSPQEITIVNEQLQNAQVMVRSRSELTVHKMCFCSKIHGFALYEPVADNHAFVAGTKDRLGEEVWLYVELKNFNSERSKDGGYVTKLACTLDLQDSTGKTVWSRTPDRAETVRRSRLNDFYRGYRFWVPAIPPGTYQLTLQVTDETNPEQKRTARESLVFRVTPVAN